MSQDWAKDKRWADRFMYEIKGILGQQLIGEPPCEEDRERNTDLMVLKMEAVRIGCRVRTNDYLSRYPDEFTIRTSRPSGCKTELAKIIEGWGDYFFYGFSDFGELRLAKWTLCSLSSFRIWFMSQLVNHKGCIPGIENKNKDGSSSFRAFKLSSMRSDFVVARFPEVQLTANGQG